MASSTLKRNYRCFQSLQKFYSGGPYAVSSDGSFIACACDDTIKIVDSSNASIKSTIEGDSQNVTALTLSPNNELLFSYSHSRQIRVWDIASLKCLRSWKVREGPVMGMACHASGGLLATAGADSEVLVWDVDGGFCTHSFKGHKGVVRSIMFHPNPDRLLLFSGSDDATVRVWDLSSKKPVETFKHESAVTSIGITEDGWTLLTAGRDQVVNIWDLHDYSFKTVILTSEAVEALCVIGPASPFASILASGIGQLGKNNGDSSAVQFITVGERGIVRIWSSQGKQKCLFEQTTSDLTVGSGEEGAKRGFTSSMLLPSGQGLLCVSADQEFLFYSPMECPETSLKLVLSRRLVGYNEEIVDMKFVGDEEQFLAVATSVEQVRVYDLASMSCSFVLAGHTDIVLCLDTCVTSTGKALIVTGSKDNSVRLWDTINGRCVGVGIGHMGAVGAVAFSKRSQNFFVSGSSDRTLKVWSLDDLSYDVDETSSLKAKAIVSAHDKDINAIAVAPNDSLVCSGSQDRTAIIWRLPSLALVVKLVGHKRGIWSVEFSPVDQRVITASGDNTVRLWNISDGSCLKSFEGHTSSVYKAAFLSRGAQLVSCDADGNVKLWDVATNESIATYSEHENKVWALTVGKKTEMLATGGSDAVINLWHDSTALDKEEAFRKEEEVVLRSQEIDNAISDADYAKAIQIAFELRRPHKLFELFAELFRKREAEDKIHTVLNAIGKDDFHLLLEYVREWNTRANLCHVAQFVLFWVFITFPPKQLLEVKGVGELLEGLISHSQRHSSRIDRLQRSTYLLDYTLSAMLVIEPEEAAEGDTIVSKNNYVDDSLRAELTKETEDEVATEEGQEGDTKEQLTEETPSRRKRKSSKSGDIDSPKETSRRKARKSGKLAA